MGLSIKNGSYDNNSNNMLSLPEVLFNIHEYLGLQIPARTQR